jgi:hypothetical protein
MLELALSLACVFFAIYLIGRWKIFRMEGVPVRVFHVLFIIKILAALSLYYIYTRFYTDRAYADIFRYYDDSAVMYGALLDHPWDFFRMLTGFDGRAPELLPYYETMKNWYNTDLIFNDSRTMIRISAFLRLFTMGTYFPHAVVMCFLAMTGLTGMVQVMRQYVRGKTLLLLLIVFMLPSILLWTSGLIKEAFLAFALGTLLYHFAEWKKAASFSLKRVLLIVFSVLILLTVKAYVLFLFVPVLIVWVFADRFPSSKRIFSLAVFVIYFGLLAGLSPFITGKSLPVLIARKQAEFYFVAEREQAKSLVQVERLQPEWKSLVSNMPGAFLRTLLLPMPQHAHNILMWLSVLENTFILLLLVFILAGFRLQLLLDMRPFPMAVFLFAVGIFVLSGLVTPIIGALVRYKVPGLPFLLFPLLTISANKWLEMKFLSTKLDVSDQPE